jgi:hypothetical protein
VPRRARVGTAAAAFSLASAIAGWLFLFPTWGFSLLAAPVGLLAGLAGLLAPRRRVAILGLALNALLMPLLLDWAEILDWLADFPTD